MDVTNPFNHRLDRGPADFDLPFVFTFSGLWAIPGRFDNPAARFVLSGWNLSSIVNIQSGFPFTILSGVDNARSGQERPACRSDWVTPAWAINPRTP